MEPQLHRPPPATRMYSPASLSLDKALGVNKGLVEDQEKDQYQNSHQHIADYGHYSRSGDSYSTVWGLHVESCGSLRSPARRTADAHTAL
ncbi:hypothetical protein SRHO_G00226830 [Serrasalmus rhombeus]